MENINLIPQEEVQLQQKGKAIKGTSVIFMLLVVITLGLSGYLYYKTSGLTRQLDEVSVSIESQRTKIKSFSATEILLRNLDKKYTSISELIAARNHYSKLLAELKIRQPAGVSIDSMEIKEGAVNYTGSAENYLLIAQFINSLLNKDFPGGNPELKDLFTAVKLNSVSTDQNKTSVNFFIVITYDAAKIKK